jgi:uncharacterized protein DUF3631
VTWPPEALWSRIAALSNTHGSPSAGTSERAKAFTTLKQIQADFDLNDTQLAYIVEYENLNPGIRVVHRERAENAFEVTLGIIDGVGLVMPFEHFVVGAAWALHTYVFPQFLHTPRLLVHSRGSGYGKTVLLSCLNELANRSRYMIAPSAAALYRWLNKHPDDTLMIDNAEHSKLWNKQDMLRQVYEAGHRQGGEIPRVVREDTVFFPTFAPLALGTIVDRSRRDKFPREILTRSIALEMKKRIEGRDEIFPRDPRFVPVRAVAARWAETFRRPKTIELPKGIVARCETNWRPLIAIGDALGYGATLRAAAIATETGNFDPELRFDEDLFSVFEQRRDSGLWLDEIMQALSEIEDGPWSALTRDALCDFFYRRGVEPRTVWKVMPDGARKSNKGVYRKQLEPLWRELGYEAQQAQASKIIRLPRHKLGTGEAQDD